MDEMKQREDSDFMTALAIGAVVGIGAALLFRASDDLDREKIIKRLKPLKKRANRALESASRRVSHKMSDARDAGRIVGRSSRKIASDMGDDAAKILEDAREDAAKIVRQARREMQASARDSVKQAQRAMRRAAKKLV
jgi:gas vesicle protein